jgi:hypothetical protein
MGPVDTGVDRDDANGVGLVEAESAEIVGGAGEPPIGFAVFVGVWRVVARMTASATSSSVGRWRPSAAASP